jgi:hypothetical protein
LINPGSAFWVKVTSGSGSLSFREGDKDAGGFQIFGARTQGSSQLLRVSLKDETGSLLYDGVTLSYTAGASYGTDDGDAAKFGIGSDNISIRRYNKDWSIEFRPPLESRDTLFLRLYNLKPKAYSLSIRGENFTLNSGLTAVLQDLYLNKETVLDIYGTNKINFTVDNAVASAGDRFRVVFRQTGTTPVTNINAGKSIEIYPNPIAKGEKIQLQFTNSTAGNYKVVLYNLVGVQVFTTTVAHNGGNVVRSLYVPQALPAGTYLTEITNSKGERQQTKLVIH